MRTILLPLLLLASAEAAGADRAIRDSHGTVVSVSASADRDGTVWTRAEIAVDGDGSILVTVGPADVLGASEFRVAIGDVVRVRYFTGEAPYDVQRMRNESTGSVFRARCLHGDPVWFGRGGRREGAGPIREGAGGRGGRR